MNEEGTVKCLRQVEHVRGHLFSPWKFVPKTLNYLAFQAFHFERTWWKLFQKHAVRTKFYIYVYISWQICVKQQSLTNSDSD
jgi:hypothetical protein